MSQLVLATSAVALISLSSLVVLSILFTKQIGLLRSLLSTEQARVTTLQNLLMSRDAMTYATLTQVGSQAADLVSDPYVSTGTDEAEYAKWQQQLGSEESYDPSDDLEELGLK